MKMEETQCSETSTIKRHTTGNNPKVYTQHSEHSESLKSINVSSFFQYINTNFCFNNSFISTLSPLWDYQYMYGIVYITLSVET
jgi:hypothetical protein